MFGAGMIQAPRRNDCWPISPACYYYETQPFPNPLSLFFTASPSRHKTSVLISNFVECVAAMASIFPAAGSPGSAPHIVFQGMLIVSGNLSWLNFIHDRALHSLSRRCAVLLALISAFSSRLTDGKR